MSSNVAGGRFATGKAAFVRAIRGPVLLIAIGTLFTLDHFGPYHFGRTWPMLLIVFGALKLLEKIAGDGGGQPHGAPAGGPL